MPRKINPGSIRVGKGSAPQGTVEDSSLRHPNRDVDPLRVHLQDPSRAHMASAIGILDAGGYYTSDDVEGALQELGSGASGGAQNGWFEAGTSNFGTSVTSVGLQLTLSGTWIGGIGMTAYDASGLQITLPNNATRWVYLDSSTLQLAASSGIPDITTNENLVVGRFTTSGGSVTLKEDGRFFTRNDNRKITYSVRQEGAVNDANSEGAFFSLEAAFLWLEAFTDSGSVSRKGEIIVRGQNIVSSTLTPPSIEGLHIRGEDGCAIITGAALSPLLDLNNCRGFVIKDIAFVCTVASEAILVQNCFTGEISGCQFVSGGADWSEVLEVDSSVGINVRNGYVEGDGSLINIHDSDAVSVENTLFNISGGSPVLIGANSEFVRIVNVFSRGAMGTGVNIDASLGSVSDVLVEGCTFKDFSASGVYVTGEASEVRVHECTFSEPSVTATLATPALFSEYDPISARSPRGVEFSNNVVRGATHGVYVSGSPDILATTDLTVASLPSSGDTLTVSLGSNAVVMTARSKASGGATVVATPSTATLTIGDVQLTNAGGARTSGQQDYDGTLGTVAAIAADIIAAINDPWNEFDVTATSGGGGSIILTAKEEGTGSNGLALATTDVTDITVTGSSLSGGEAIAENEFPIGATVSETAENITSKITLASNSVTNLIRGSVSGAVVTVIAVPRGVAGNSITLVSSDPSMVVSASPLSGGVDRMAGDYRVVSNTFRNCGNTTSGTSWGDETFAVGFQNSYNVTVSGNHILSQGIDANTGQIFTGTSRNNGVQLSNCRDVSLEGNQILDLAASTSASRRFIKIGYTEDALVEGDLFLANDIKISNNLVGVDLNRDPASTAEIGVEGAAIEVLSNIGSLETAAFRISSWAITNNNSRSTSSGFVFVGLGNVSYSGISIQGNTLVTDPNESQDPGIAFGGASNSGYSEGQSLYSQIVISGNTLFGFEKGVVFQSSRFEGSSLIGNCVVTNNIIERCSDAAIGVSSTVAALRITRSPLVAGDRIFINGAILEGVAGARTSGANDFNVNAGSVSLIAADIAAAINDPANSVALRFGVNPTTLPSLDGVYLTLTGVPVRTEAGIRVQSESPGIDTYTSNFEVSGLKISDNLISRSGTSSSTKPAIQLESWINSSQAWSDVSISGNEIMDSGASESHAVQIKIYDTNLNEWDVSDNKIGGGSGSSETGGVYIANRSSDERGFGIRRVRIERNRITTTGELSSAIGTIVVTGSPIAVALEIEAISLSPVAVPVPSSNQFLQAGTTTAIAQSIASAINQGTLRSDGIAIATVNGSTVTVRAGVAYPGSYGNHIRMDDNSSPNLTLSGSHFSGGGRLSDGSPGIARSSRFWIYLFDNFSLSPGDTFTIKVPDRADSLWKTTPELLFTDYVFTFIAAGPPALQEIVIGASVQDTIDNLIEAVNSAIGNGGSQDEILNASRITSDSVGKSILFETIGDYIGLYGNRIRYEQSMPFSIFAISPCSYLDGFFRFGEDHSLDGLMLESNGVVEFASVSDNALKVRSSSPTEPRRALWIRTESLVPAFVSGAFAQALMTVVDYASLDVAGAQTFTLFDGYPGHTTVTYQYIDSSGSGANLPTVPAAGNIGIDLDSAVSAQDVAENTTIIINATLSNQNYIGAFQSTIALDEINLYVLAPGTQGNSGTFAETVTDAGFIITNASTIGNNFEGGVASDSETTFDVSHDFNVNGNKLHGGAGSRIDLYGGYTLRNVQFNNNIVEGWSESQMDPNSYLRPWPESIDDYDAFSIRFTGAYLSPLPNILRSSDSCSSVSVSNNQFHFWPYGCVHIHKSDALENFTGNIVGTSVDKNTVSLCGFSGKNETIFSLRTWSDTIVSSTIQDCSVSGNIVRDSAVYSDNGRYINPLFYPLAGDGFSHSAIIDCLSISPAQNVRVDGNQISRCSATCNTASEFKTSNAGGILFWMGQTYGTGSEGMGAGRGNSVSSNSVRGLSVTSITGDISYAFGAHIHAGMTILPLGDSTTVSAGIFEGLIVSNNQVFEVPAGESDSVNMALGSPVATLGFGISTGSVIGMGRHVVSGNTVRLVPPTLSGGGTHSFVGIGTSAGLLDQGSYQGNDVFMAGVDDGGTPIDYASAMTISGGYVANTSISGNNLRVNNTDSVDANTSVCLGLTAPVTGSGSPGLYAMTVTGNTLYNAPIPLGSSGNGGSGLICSGVAIVSLVISNNSITSARSAILAGGVGNVFSGLTVSSNELISTDPAYTPLALSGTMTAVNVTGNVANGANAASGGTPSGPAGCCMANTYVGAGSGWDDWAHNGGSPRFAKYRDSGSGSLNDN